MNTDQIKILLVEDDIPTQMVYQFYLKKLGYGAELVATGKKAIQYVQSQPSGYYQAMILDLGLPDVGGEVVMESIRNYEKQTNRKPLPIMITTAHSDEATLTACCKLGANCAFAKPVQRTIFEQILPELIHDK